jgi:hypothetical protein
VSSEFTRRDRSTRAPFGGPGSLDAAFAHCSSIICGTAIMSILRPLQ